MAEPKQKTPAAGILLGVAFLALLILKLQGAISWSWWIVTMPLWGASALACGVLGAVLFMTTLLSCREILWREKQKRIDARMKWLTEQSAKWKAQEAAQLKQLVRETIREDVQRSDTVRRMQ